MEQINTEIAWAAIKDNYAGVLDRVSEGGSCDRSWCSGCIYKDAGLCNCDHV
jgi:hypothetical protein